MVSIFYYDYETENLFSEEDAEEVSVEELLEELFNLYDDNESYVGIITDKNKYQIKSKAYDSYDIYIYNSLNEEYADLYLNMDYECCQSFCIKLFD